MDGNSITDPLQLCSLVGEKFNSIYQNFPEDHRATPQACTTINCAAIDILYISSEVVAKSVKFFNPNSVRGLNGTPLYIIKAFNTLSPILSLLYNCSWSLDIFPVLAIVTQFLNLGLLPFQTTNRIHAQRFLKIFKRVITFIKCSPLTFMFSAWIHEESFYGDKPCIFPIFCRTYGPTDHSSVGPMVLQKIDKERVRRSHLFELSKSLRCHIICS